MPIANGAADGSTLLVELVELTGLAKNLRWARPKKYPSLMPVSQSDSNRSLFGRITEIGAYQLPEELARRGTQSTLRQVKDPIREQSPPIIDIKVSVRSGDRPA